MRLPPIPIAADRAALDLAKPEQIEEALDGLAPELIINRPGLPIFTGGDHVREWRQMYEQASSWIASACRILEDCAGSAQPLSNGLPSRAALNQFLDRSQHFRERRCQSDYIPPPAQPHGLCGFGMSGISAR